MTIRHLKQRDLADRWNISPARSRDGGGSARVPNTSRSAAASCTGSRTSRHSSGSGSASAPASGGRAHADAAGAPEVRGSRCFSQACSPSLTEIAFCAWVAAAGPETELEYHRGFLAVDVSCRSSQCSRRPSARRSCGWRPKPIAPRRSTSCASSSVATDPPILATSPSPGRAPRARFPTSRRSPSPRRPR